ncbi:MAG TPA: sulfate adenylyltransferase subunit CysD [Caulobacteraceae bacterium]|jgi:sulfate adenylyltransferase subunit 2
MLSPHLRALEAEAVEIIRETAAECERPVLLYSIGKDSGALLHLAQKAFRPAAIPFPLLHVDTGWKFREMYEHRNRVAARPGMTLVVHRNEDGLAAGVNPIASGSAVHTRVMKTEALKQALERHGFTAALGGARRDEEKSRAKERVFSVRTRGHGWDPRRQRPELWRLYNARVGEGETLRVFPLSNWTELDVWEYTRAEGIPVVPLYFAAPRPVLRRDGALIVREDDRLPLLPGEQVEQATVRFRSLGDWPLSAAVESDADTLDAIIEELRASRASERAGRLIDADEASSMERKKREGYF